MHLSSLAAYFVYHALYERAQLHEHSNSFFKEVRAFGMLCGYLQLCSILPVLPSICPYYTDTQEQSTHTATLAGTAKCIYGPTHF
jgi:hypothetical protein